LLLYSRGDTLSFNYYIPNVSNNISKKGVGVDLHQVNAQDLYNLGVGWWYNWYKEPFIDTRIEFIPMSWAGYFFQTNSSNILLFNEPNDPYQSNLTPSQAVDRYKVFLDAYGVDKLIVGGVTPWGKPMTGGQWLIAFLEELDNRNIQRPTRWHAHGYVGGTWTPEVIISFWESYRGLTGGKYWISEFGDPQGNHETYEKLVPWLENCVWIERYAAFTTRLSGKEPWYPASWPNPPRMQLVENGILTSLGELYRDL
jgi:hypothetical protein